MRGGYQPVQFPGIVDENAILLELERLEVLSAQLPLSVVHPQRFSGLLHAPILELDSIVRRVERDPLLAVSILRLVTDELAEVDSVRISDCIVIAGRERLLALAEAKNFAVQGTPAMDDFAERSRVFSLIASRLAASTGRVDPNAARLAGLLHAMGEIPILLARRDPQHYSAATIAGWGKRLASSWRLPSALVRAVTAYDTQVCYGAPDPMQQLIGAARRLANSRVLEEVPLAVALLDRERASEAKTCLGFN